jgi:hypothetical protein
VNTPSSRDLVNGRLLKPPNSARGIFLDRQSGKHAVRMRFVFAASNRWIWLHSDGEDSGAISDGNTHVVVSEGTAVLVTHEGEVCTSSRFMCLLNPMRFDFSKTRLGPAQLGERLGRDAWVLPSPGKGCDELAFDRDTGVLLYMKSSDQYLGFEELILDDVVDDGIFSWAGPIEPRKIGTTIVFPEEAGTYSAIWEISIRGRAVYSLNAPTGMTRKEALDWGESRATRTLVRPDV